MHSLTLLPYESHHKVQNSQQSCKFMPSFNRSLQMKFGLFLTSSAFANSVRKGDEVPGENGWTGNC